MLGACKNDITEGKPGTVLTRYKIQPGTNSPLSKKRFRELLGLVAFNQIVVGGITQYMFYLMHKQFHNTTPMTIEVMPSVLRVLLELTVFVIIEEVLFFYLHWICS